VKVNGVHVPGVNSTAGASNQVLLASWRNSVAASPPAGASAWALTAAPATRSVGAGLHAEPQLLAVAPARVTARLRLPENA
jgi:hypothetical protein